MPESGTGAGIGMPSHAEKTTSLFCFSGLATGLGDVAIDVHKVPGACLASVFRPLPACVLRPLPAHTESCEKPCLIVFEKGAREVKAGYKKVQRLFKALPEIGPKRLSDCFFLRA